MSDDERCKHDDGDACIRLAIGITDGAHKSSSGHDALSLFQRACSLGSAIGCTRGGLLIEQGSESVTANPSLAESLYQKGCDGNDMTACRHLRLLRTSKKITPSQPGKGQALLQRACDGKESWSCCELGRLYDSTGNRQQAAVFFRQGCKLGYQAACDELR